jgi:hypothetical protein
MTRSMFASRAADMPTALGGMARRTSPLGNGTAGVSGVRRLAAANSRLSNAVFPWKRADGIVHATPDVRGRMRARPYVILTGLGGNEQPDVLHTM